MPAPPTWPRRPTASPAPSARATTIEAINRMFAPEFRNRLDAIITFAHLSQEIIAKVVEKFVLQLEAQLGDRNVTIELSDEATRWLIANGYDELMGARPMARVIQEHIKKPLADEVLFGQLKGGGHVRVVVDQGRGRPRQARLRVSSTGRSRRSRKSCRRCGPRPSAARRRGRRARPSAARCRRCRWSRSERAVSKRQRRRPGHCARPSHFAGARMRAAARGCARGGAMRQDEPPPCPRPAPSIPIAAAFFGGVKSAWTSVFFLVLGGTYIGIGALAHDFGLRPGGWRCRPCWCGRRRRR